MIGLVTDSASQIPPSLASRLGVQVVPITVTIDGIESREGVDLSAESASVVVPMLARLLAGRGRSVNLRGVSSPWWRLWRRRFGSAWLPAWRRSSRRQKGYVSDTARGGARDEPSPTPP